MADQNAIRILADYIDTEDLDERDGDMPLSSDLAWCVVKSYWENFLVAGTGLKPNLPLGAPPSGVTALEALAAGRVLTEHLQGSRWWMAAEARKQGASWRNIGDALGMTKQAAWEGFRKFTAEHESYAPSFRQLNAEYRALAGGSCDE